MSKKNHKIIDPPIKILAKFKHEKFNTHIENLTHTHKKDSHVITRYASTNKHIIRFYCKFHFEISCYESCKDYTYQVDKYAFCFSQQNGLDKQQSDVENA